jgi:LysR family cys regulon transcriptional activator
MNLRQLRYIADIAERDLSISAVASSLHTAQSGISKQVKLLENELGIEIFVRARGRLRGVTPLGGRVIEYATNALGEIANIRALSEERKRPSKIAIATSHTQARYVLPDITRRFSARYPKVRISLAHGSPAEIAELVRAGKADIGVSTESARMKELLSLPYRRFERVVIVPCGHSLLAMKRVTLKALARYPLVSYEPQYSGRRDVVKAFEKAGLAPRMPVSATDADVIKTYVEQGLGIAVLSEVTFDPVRDVHLQAMPAHHLFAPSTTMLLLNRKRYLQQHAYDFIEMCLPRWTRAAVQRAAAGSR